MGSSEFGGGEDVGITGDVEVSVEVVELLGNVGIRNVVVI
jgi:hypothetical protein